MADKKLSVLKRKTRRQIWKDSTVQDYLDVKSVETMKKKIESDILVWPINSRTGSFYILEQCLTNRTGTKHHEN